LGELDLVNRNGLLLGTDSLEVSVALADFSFKDLVQPLDLLSEQYNSVLDLVVSILVNSDIVELDLDSGVPLSPFIDFPLLGLDDCAQFRVSRLD
jgi:hypothetical protein